MNILNIKKDKTYSVVSGESPLLLSIAPFTVSMIDDGFFTIVGSSSEIKFSEYASIVVEESKPLVWEQGNRYTLDKNMKDEFIHSYGHGRVFVSGREDVLEFLGDVPVFTVGKVNNYGDVSEIIEKEIPGDFPYQSILEYRDRRYFAEVRDRVKPSSPTLEEKLEALFSIPGKAYHINDPNTGRKVGIDSFDSFVGFINSELKSDSEMVERTLDHLKNNLAIFTKVGENISNVMK